FFSSQTCEVVQDAAFVDARAEHCRSVSSRNPWSMLFRGIELGSALCLTKMIGYCVKLFRRVFVHRVLHWLDRVHCVLHGRDMTTVIFYGMLVGSRCPMTTRKCCHHKCANKSYNGD